ncbi:hypothetical protein BDB01DRAFT_900323 [Pilobolus umbonatus]|nr:hypothetical protein BDB01DRAFT_900323 [Pilobolus umbonatus]
MSSGSCNSNDGITIRHSEIRHYLYQFRMKMYNKRHQDCYGTQIWKVNVIPDSEKEAREEGSYCCSRLRGGIRGGKKCEVPHDYLISSLEETRELLAKLLHSWDLYMIKVDMRQAHELTMNILNARTSLPTHAKRPQCICADILDRYHTSPARTSHPTPEPYSYYLNLPLNNPPFIHPISTINEHLIYP